MHKIITYPIGTETGGMGGLQSSNIMLYSTQLTNDIYAVTNYLKAQLLIKYTYLLCFVQQIT